MERPRILLFLFLLFTKGSTGIAGTYRRKGKLALATRFGSRMRLPELPSCRVNPNSKETLEPMFNAPDVGAHSHWRQCLQ